MSGALGLLGGVEAISGVSGDHQDVGVSGVYFGASRDSRYSGTRRGIGASGGIGASKGVGAILGCQGESGGVGMSGVYWGLAGTLGTQGPEGV